MLDSGDGAGPTGGILTPGTRVYRFIVLLFVSLLTFGSYFAYDSVGAIAPNLRLTKLDGAPVSLDEFRGQRVLINSWASW